MLYGLIFTVLQGVVVLVVQSPMVLRGRRGLKTKPNGNACHPPRVP